MCLNSLLHLSQPISFENILGPTQHLHDSEMNVLEIFYI